MASAACHLQSFMHVRSLDTDTGTINRFWPLPWLNSSLPE